MHSCKQGEGLGREGEAGVNKSPYPRLGTAALGKVQCPIHTVSFGEEVQSIVFSVLQMWLGLAGLLEKGITEYHADDSLLDQRHAEPF